MLVSLFQYALYLAYKVGPNPSFKRLVMLSASTEDEKLLVSYIGAFTAAFRAAPASLSKAMGGPSGLFLMIDANPVDTGNESRSKRNSPTRDSPKLRGHGHSYDGTHSKGGSSVGGALIISSWFSSCLVGCIDAWCLY